MGMMTGFIRQGLWALADVLFPPTCAGCDSLGAALCPACRAALEWVPPGRALVDLSAPDGLDDFRAALWFGGPAQKALHRLKYRHDVGLAETLVGLVARRLARPELDRHATLIVPVPLSAERLAERGYNQAALLARGLADRWSFRFAPRALSRVRATRSQVGLSRADRLANVEVAFWADRRIVQGRSILLLDDTCTTGATLQDCARALKVAGAVAVHGLAIAQAPLRQAMAPAGA